MLESSELSATAGAALSKPFMPGTAVDTLPNSSALRRLLANANSVPAPPRACVREMKSPLVKLSDEFRAGAFRGLSDRALGPRPGQDQQDAKPSPSPPGEQSMRSESHFVYLVRTSIVLKPEVMATRKNASDALRLVIANRRVRQSGLARVTKIDVRMRRGWDRCVNPSQRRPETFCT